MQSKNLLDMSIFRAYDIRGIYPSQINAQFGFDLGRVLSAQCENDGLEKIVVAFDARDSSSELANYFVTGLMTGSKKTKVLVIGEVPTPFLYFATRANGGFSQSGVMITASHNPSDYNGFKLCLNANRLFGEQIKAIAHKIEKLETIPINLIKVIDLAQLEIVNIARIEIKDIKSEYIRALEASLKLKPVALTKNRSNIKLKVVLDAGNGITGAFAPELFRHFGFEVIELYCELDGNFPNHPPDSSRAENLVDLQKSVIKNKADFGLAFDGDGDRLGVVDNLGKILSNDQLILLFALDILKDSKELKNKNIKLIHDVKCSNLISEILKPLGSEVILCATGHSFISQKIKQTGAEFAGEMSGHLFFNDRWAGFDDGIYAGLRLAELLQNINKTKIKNLAELSNQFPLYYNTPEILVSFATDEKKFNFINQFISIFSDKNIKQSKDYTLCTIDGIRLNFNPSFATGWGLVRASNTLPVLTIRFEAKNKKELTKISNFFLTKISQVDTKVSEIVRSQL